MKVLEQSLLDEMTQRLVEEFDPEQIILFGSHAWGEPDEDSDVDILVIVSGSNEPLIRRCQQAEKAMGDLLVPTDILVKTRKEVDRFRDVYASLECEVLERGKVLYDGREAGTCPVMAHQGSA